MIETRQDGALWRFTLNRPDKANAVTAQMLGDLADGVERAVAEGAKAIVLTGAGKVFSAGADLDAARAGLATDPVWERLSGAIASAPCLTIAALNGTVAGGSMGMALACDLRIAAPSAKAFYPVMKLGFLPQPSDPVRLSALIGPARAKMILMAGHKTTAEEALAWGLFDQLSDAPLATAHTLASDALTAAPAHIAGIKGLVP
jgi:enoyl-CoA hydratase